MAAVLAILPVLASACSTSGKPRRAPAPQNLEQLRRAITAIIKRHSVDGVGVAMVAKDRVIWAGGVGMSDVRRGVSVNADTMFRLGSLAKSVIALAVLKLQEDGKLSLDETVKAAAPALSLNNPWARGDPVTIAELLEHTAGLPDCGYSNFYDFRAPPGLPIVDVLRLFPGFLTVQWRPGSCFDYSNPGYSVAAYIIDSASGEPFDRYIEEGILRPVGMQDSGFALTPERRAALAQGYDGNPPEPVPAYSLYVRPGAGLISSSAEMARFLRLMLNRGTLDGTRVVGASSISRMEVPRTSMAARAGLKAGYGLGLRRDMHYPFKTYGLDGYVAGFVSEYRYLPDLGVGYFLAVGSSSAGGFLSMGEIDRLVFGYLTRGVPIPAAPPAPTGTDRSRWVGVYTPTIPHSELLGFEEIILGGQRVFVKHGLLYRQPLSGATEELIPVGRDTFRTPEQRDAGVVFYTDRSGATIMSDGYECLRRGSPWWPTMRLWLALGAAAVMASALAAALFWAVAALFRGAGTPVELALKLMPVAPVLVLLALRRLVIISSDFQLATLDWRSLGLFLGTILFALLSVVSMVFSLALIRSHRLGIFARIHGAAVSLACTATTLYLASWGLIGIRTWRF
jgi:CubicO group peptidase (beta-lactamase class C family)